MAGQGQMGQEITLVQPAWLITHLTQHWDDMLAI